MVGPLAIDAYLPSFVAIKTELHASDQAMQLTLGIFLAAFAGMMLFYGTLSDSFGRKRVIMWSLAVYALGSMGAALSNSIGMLLFFRMVQGFGAGGGGVVARAVVRDLFKGADAQRMMSQMTMVFGLAPAIAPVLGGYIDVGLGWRWVFGFSLLFSVVLGAFCWHYLPESLPPEKRNAFQPKVIAGHYWACLRDPRFMLIVTMLAFSFAGFSIYIGAASHFVIDILGKTVTDFAVVFVPLVAGLVIGAAIASRMAYRLSRKQFIVIGFGLQCTAVAFNIGYNLFATQAAVPWAVLPLFIYSFGVSFVVPAATMAAMDLFPKHQGLASSIQSCMQMMVFSCSVSIFVPMLYRSSLLLALGMLTMWSISCLIYAFLRWRFPAKALPF